MASLCKNMQLDKCKISSFCLSNWAQFTHYGYQLAKYIGKIYLHTFFWTKTFWKKSKASTTSFYHSYLPLIHGIWNYNSLNEKEKTMRNSLNDIFWTKIKRVLLIIRILKRAPLFQKIKRTPHHISNTEDTLIPAYC